MSNNFNINGIVFDFDQYYLQPYQETLEIIFESNKIPRFCCACHKLNLAIRAAIDLHEPLKKILELLNKVNACIRRSIKLNQMFKDKKCRLRCENQTRWSSAFLLLESVKRAFDKGVFNSQLECPVEYDQFEIYFIILKNSYETSLKWQQSSSTIGDVLPGDFIF